MSWILNLRPAKKKAKRSTRSKRGQQRQPWDPQRTMLGVKVLVGLGVLVGGALGWRVTERALWDYANQTRHVDLSIDHIELRNAPRWMGQSVQEQVKLTAASWAKGDPMDGRSLHIASLALAEDPWVAQVHQVQRLTDGRIVVDATYREPIALVATRDGYRLTDRGGVVLPGLYLEHQIDKLNLPVVSGVSESTPRPGQAWQSEDVLAGLALVDTLAGEPYADQIVRYDVSHRDSRGRVRLVLHTEDGMVRWGLPPGMEQAIEPTADVKRSWLRYVSQTRGGIDAGGKVVDVYGARIAVYQPAINP